MTRQERPRKRLDERVAPGWANLSATLLRGGGLVVGLFLLWLGFVTGGFFLLLTGVLAALALIGGWLLGGLMTREIWYERPNARLISIALVVLFPVALIVFAQLAGPLLTPPPTTAACFTGTLARGEERHEPLAVDPRLDTMQFSLQISDISGGAMRWFVQDPTGQSQWSGRREEAGTVSSEVLTAVGGEWTVNVISEADLAEYRIDWTATIDGQPDPDLPPCPRTGGS